MAYLLMIRHRENMDARAVTLDAALVREHTRHRFVGFIVGSFAVFRLGRSACDARVLGREIVGGGHEGAVLCPGPVDDRHERDDVLLRPCHEVATPNPSLTDGDRSLCERVSGDGVACMVTVPFSATRNTLSVGRSVLESELLYWQMLSAPAEHRPCRRRPDWRRCHAYNECLWDGYMAGKHHIC